ncbi:MAG TPA: hypothetical protein VFR85_19295 [Anaeromyxobacteraceae bacterium]|nr:hypothetical protein [Anaeromyxobacteraceae bacterium]
MLDAYGVVDEHRQKAHCQVDLRLLRYELPYPREFILSERAASPARQGAR